MRRFALRYLTITPDQYWLLTPVELSEMIEGAQWRRYQDWEIAAWVSSHIINMSGKVSKKVVKANDLLGKNTMPKAPRDPASDIRELMARQEAINAESAN